MMWAKKNALWSKKEWSWAACAWTLEQFIISANTICTNHRKSSIYASYLVLVNRREATNKMSDNILSACLANKCTAFRAHDFCLKYTVYLRFAFVNLKWTFVKIKQSIQLTSGVHQGRTIRCHHSLKLSGHADFAKVLLSWNKAEFCKVVNVVLKKSPEQESKIHQQIVSNITIVKAFKMWGTILIMSI